MPVKNYFYQVSIEFVLHFMPTCRRILSDFQRFLMLTKLFVVNERFSFITLR
jgi:hypothetical protein